MPASNHLGRPLKDRLYDTSTTFRAWKHISTWHHHIPQPVGSDAVPCNQPAFTHDPLADLQQLLDLTCHHTPIPEQTPTHPLWAGYLSYQLGSLIEPAARAPTASAQTQSSLPEPLPWPLIELTHITPTRPPAGCCQHQPTPGLQTSASLPTVPIELRAAQGKLAYTRMVRTTLDAIAAGDIYQACITHQLLGSFSGDPRQLFAQLARTARPAHGMYLASPVPLEDGSFLAVLSLSPELFLSFDAKTRMLRTKPMKGTRPGTCAPTELLDAEKDRAELAMIVDLMRNDLGRICEFGSVHVQTPRQIERHASGPGEILQATATVVGTVRKDCSTTDMLRATFPPGSVTGAPKIRAMQIIDELEPFARNPYCGCIGSFYADGSFELAVAIRTVLLRGQRDPVSEHFIHADLTYGIGAGIVADSDPQLEWLETLDKARVLEPIFTIPDA